MTASPSEDELLRARLNQETARIPWQSLLRFFAQGRVYQVAAGQDLIELAVWMTRDDAAAIETAMRQEQLRLVDDDTARRWVEADASVWAVVVKPWILVQEKHEETGTTEPPVQLH